MTLYLILLEGVVLAGLLLFLWFQIIYPLVKGTPLFPYFRLSSVKDAIHEVEHQLEETADEIRLKQLNAELERRKAQLKDIE